MDAMTDRQREAARTAILTFCQDKAKTLREILESPTVAPFVEACGRRAVKELTYALANSSLLFQAGTTRGALYVTTRVGKLVLTA